MRILRIHWRTRIWLRSRSGEFKLWSDRVKFLLIQGWGLDCKRAGHERFCTTMADDTLTERNNKCVLVIIYHKYTLLKLPVQRRYWNLVPSLVLWLLASLPTVIQGGHLSSLHAVRAVPVLNFPNLTFLKLVVFCIGSIFQCAATTLVHLFIGRAIGGIGVGALRFVVSSLTIEVDWRP